MTNVMGASPQKPEFGLADYWRMYKARGIRLPLNYFFQAHAFDLLHGTDTHSWYVEDIGQGQGAMEGSAPDGDVLYRCSWTTEIRKAFDALRLILGSEFEEYVFVDIGCGKGKAVLTLAKCLKRRGLRQRLVGLDFHWPFVHVAKSNQMALDLLDAASIVCADAAEYHYAGLGRKLIAYLYNPFGAATLCKVLARMDEMDAVIVYNNPVHADAVHACGYRTIWERRGWHPNAQTMMFRKVGIA